MLDFSLSSSASKRISFLLDKKIDKKFKLRISVEGGGCAGFQYNYVFVLDQPTKDDIFIEDNGARVLIDKISLELIKGSILDYKENLAGSYFHIKNPHASSSCGCGNSFST